MSLESISAAMLDQLPAARQDLLRQERRLEKFGNIAFGGFAVVLALGILGFLYYILTQMVLGEAQPLPGILLMAFIVFAGLSLAYVAWNESLKEKRKRLTDSAMRSPELMENEPRPALGDPVADWMPSVVEDTTRSLNRRKTRDL